ncbi:MAG: hypothetical protein LC802_10600 [Acidobacteria bacterium]|nr:hypothetical protein [Acidobacteriota bacterium]
MKGKTTPPLDGPAVIPRWLLRRREVSHGAKLTYVRLRQLAGRGRVATALVPALARELGERGAEITRFLAELREWGLVEAVAGGAGGGSTARCFMPFHPWMDESAPEGKSAGGSARQQEGCSRFSFEECFEYATHVAEKRANSERPIDEVRALAGRFRKGADDEEIAAWFAAEEKKDRAEERPNVLSYKKQTG